MNNLSEQHVHSVRVGSLSLATEMFNDESSGLSNNFGLCGSTRCVEFASVLAAFDQRSAKLLFGSARATALFQSSGLNPDSTTTNY